jgi:PKD repeat protein
VRDFGAQTGRIVGLERHPITGDIWAVSMSTNQVVRIRYGSNLTPHAIATVTPSAGDPPLMVQLGGSLSNDPDQDPITFDWDFDDGSPHSDIANPVHTYTQVGVYHPMLTVTDSFGLAGTTTIQVAVGNSPPFAKIRAPIMGSTYTVPVQLALFGNGVDPEGFALTYQWSISLYHAIHVHPGTFTSNQQNVLFDISSSPEDPELHYYEAILTVTDVGGLTDTDHVFVYPTTHVKDVTGEARPISSLDVLSPPVPLASSHPDIEVIRDGKHPPIGDVHVQRQFATSHNGAQGSDDWIGYEFTQPHGPEFRFVGLEFQEGMHFVDGGWLETMAVEVRQGGVWTAVSDLTIKPSYPFAQSRTPSFDGVGYQTYDLTFVPRGGDAIRLRGDPGGATGFLSCAELRVRAIEAHHPGALHDITSVGSVIVPGPGFLRPTPRIPYGGDPSVVSNGTFPPVGSASSIAEYRTVPSDPLAPAPMPWIGYAFQSPRDVSRVVFQEGRELAGAGALASIDVQYRSTAGGAWTSVTGLASTPIHPGANGVNYETVVLDFTAVSARAIRVVGPPAIPGGDLSVGEMRVFGPTPP